MSELLRNFDREFKIATLALRFNRSSPNTNYNILCKIQCFISVLISFICFTFLLYSILTHDIPKQIYYEAIKNSIMVILATVITFKYIILIYHRDSIRELIRTINEDYAMAQHLPEEDKSVIIKYSQKGKTICKIWFFIAAYTCSVFPIKAFVLMARSYLRGEFRLYSMFDMTYPECINVHKYEPTGYFLLFMMTFLFALFAGSVYIGFDPLVPILMLHACGQLHLLRRRILSVFANNCEPHQAKENLKEVNIKIESIYRFVKTVQDVFIVLYEYNLKTTTFFIPFAGFQIFESFRKHEINPEFTVFFVGTVLHFYIPCYYSDLLMEASERMRQAIYSCGWEKTTDIKNKKTILFMLTRTTKPLVIRTIFSPICLDTFAEMCRQAYAIYNIMNAAWT